MENQVRQQVKRYGIEKSVIFAGTTKTMRDMYALANCGALVAGESQVSLAARITKYSLGSCYYDEDILTHGVVKNGNDSNKYYMHERYKY